MKSKFNCVDMKHKSAEKIKKKMQGYSLEEELIYWQKRSADLQIKKEKLSDKKEHAIN